MTCCKNIFGSEFDGESESGEKNHMPYFHQMPPLNPVSLLRTGRGFKNLNPPLTGTYNNLEEHGNHNIQQTLGMGRLSRGRTIVPERFF